MTMTLTPTLQLQHLRMERDISVARFAGSAAQHLHAAPHAFVQQNDWRGSTIVGSSNFASCRMNKFHNSQWHPGRRRREYASGNLHVESVSGKRHKEFERHRTRLAVKSTRSDVTGGLEKRADMAILMEIEGVLAEVQRYSNRQGFNIAFQELGLDCAQWTEAIYTDLIRASGGAEDKMVTFFFSRIGWPSTLPTNEQGVFVRKVLEGKSRAVEKLVGADGVPLRRGLEKFVDEVLEANIPLVILAAYYKGGEQVARKLVEKLGSDRLSRIRVVGNSDVENSAYGQVVLGKGASSGLDEELAAAASKAVAAEKQKFAEEVASLLKLTVEIDTSAAHSSKQTIAALRAGAEIGQADVDHCILLASGLAGSQAAQQIGMPCIVLRSSATARAEFPAAKAVLDDYGPGSVTLPRLLKFI